MKNSEKKVRKLFVFFFSNKVKILSISKRMENERENLRAGRHVKKQFGF